MRSRSFGMFVLVIVALLLQSCSWTSHQTAWMYTTLDPDGGDRFDWQDQNGQIELVAKPADAGVEVTKVHPDDLWGLRQGDLLISVGNKPTRSVRDLLADLHAMKGADAMAVVKRRGAKVMVKLRGADYRVALPPPIAPNDSMAAGGRDLSRSTAFGVD